MLLELQNDRIKQQTYRMNLLLLMVALGLAGASPLNYNKECQPHSRPWQVYLKRGGHCSAALVDRWWLVTTFSCALGTGAIASLGDHDVTVEEGTEQHIPIAGVIFHNPYRSPMHSLAMVRLSRPAVFNQYVQPIPLPSRCPQPGETCNVSGWGSTISNQYEPAQHLKCITVPVVDDQTCQNTFPRTIYWSPGMLCAGQVNTDNCMGQEGSVMVCDGQLQGVQWISSGCRNPATPSVYTKLCKYTDWIQNVIDHNSPTTTAMTTRSYREANLPRDKM